VLALGILALLGIAGRSPAQLEPEAFTILKEALNRNPPAPADAVAMLLKYKGPVDRAKLQATWLASLRKEATGGAAARRKKMEEMFDAFDESFAAGDCAKQRAQAFIKLREGLLARETSEKEIERSASAFVDQLRALPEAKRSVLQEFGRLAKRNINNVGK
jgi:hypothetical protein